MKGYTKECRKKYYYVRKRNVFVIELSIYT